MPYQAKNGTYVAEFKRVINGKLQTGKKRGFKYLKDARLWESKRIEELEEKSIISESKTEDVIDNYLEYRKEKVRDSSFEHDVTIVNKYIYPYFDRKKSLSEIGFNEVSKWKKDILSLNISNARKNKIITCFKAIIERGKLLNSIDEKEANKCILSLDKIATKNVQIKEEDEIHFWTIEQINTFLNTFEKDDFYLILFRVLLFTGLRISELLGLTYNDINFESKTIKINKQYNVRKHEFKPTKTEKSNRTILLDDVTFSMIKDFCDNTFSGNKKKRIFDKTKNPIVQIFTKHTKKAELPKIRIHDLRHSHCSMLIESYIKNNLSIDFLSIANRLGHSVQETMDVYAHMYPTANQNMIDLINHI